MSDDVTREVDRLLQEREKYETWLERLEQEKGQSSERAYQRVRDDYRNRLAEITDELGAHADDIHSRLEQLRTRAEELEEQRAARSDELEEARLRRNVGEYEDDEWAELEGELSGAVDQVVNELETTREEISRLSEIVEQVERPRPEPAPEPSGEPRAESERAPEPPSVEPAPVSGSSEGASDEDEGFMSLEELVFGEGETEPADGPAGTAEGAGPGPADDQVAGAAGSETGAGDDEGVGDELAFLESLSLEGEATEEEDSFSFLDQGGRGERQTIICPHCSAANDPAEWYCTECGEELPAE